MIIQVNNVKHAKNPIMNRMSQSTYKINQGVNTNQISQISLSKTPTTRSNLIRGKSADQLGQHSIMSEYRPIKSYHSVWAENGGPRSAPWGCPQDVMRRVPNGSSDWAEEGSSRPGSSQSTLATVRLRLAKSGYEDRESSA